MPKKTFLQKKLGSNPPFFDRAKANDTSNIYFNHKQSNVPMALKRPMVEIIMMNKFKTLKNILVVWPRPNFTLMVAKRKGPLIIRCT